jgi:methylamine---glutamate N-methyltransferase subunit A
MCGIVGLFLKNVTLEPKLGAWLAPMLTGMSERGPDSAGFAVYRPPPAGCTVKLTLHHPDERYPWPSLRDDLAATLAARCEVERRASHCVLASDAPAEALRRALAERYPEVRLMGIGETIEIFKEKGRPEAVVERFHLADLRGSHAVGHTRMATESAVTTEHSHPFSTGLDLCLVHNGSLSNHNRLRLRLRRRGIEFQTDNDSEVAAGYLTWRLSEGASLDEALEAALSDLDGFYTFAVGTRDGFAVLRDSFACKPAVLAETDDWVAMASEYRSLAHLPGADAARIWEPAPATVYSWARNGSRPAAAREAAKAVVQPHAGV